MVVGAVDSGPFGVYYPLTAPWGRRYYWRQLDFVLSYKLN